MIDYYNTFIQQEKDIHKDLMQVFKSYPKIYISDLIYLLKDEEIITENTSVPGYYTFVRPIAIDFIEDKIQKQINLNLKKLKFTSYYLQNYKDIDVLQHILSFLN
mgnify:CR=1 FL=1